MVTTLYRIIKYGLHGFSRNVWASVSATLVMLLALSVFLSLMIFQMLTGQALEILRDKIDISVYFHTNVSEDNILKVKNSLESLKEVAKVEYISRNQALALFQERHRGDQTIEKALDVLQENPLSASLNVKAKDPQEYPIIASYLESADLKSLIDQVTYSQNQVVIDRLASIVNISRKVGIALTVVMAAIAIFVTLNTIILTIYSMREEIGVMRLVGASNLFIRGPYLVQGALYGSIAAFLTILLAMPLVSFVSPYAAKLISGVSLSEYFYGKFLLLFLYQLVLGVALGVISSLIALSRYLKK